MRAQTDIDEYARIYQAREGVRLRALATEAARIRALLPEAARMLRARFGAGRMGVFGSLAHGRFGQGSDVDLYVDRVAEGRHFEAVAALAELLGVDVDLVELATATDTLRELIEQDGRDVD